MDTLINVAFQTAVFGVPLAWWAWRHLRLYTRHAWRVGGPVHRSRRYRHLSAEGWLTKLHSWEQDAAGDWDDDPDDYTQEEWDVVLWEIEMST